MTRENGTGNREQDKGAQEKHIQQLVTQGGIYIIVRPRARAITGNVSDGSVSNRNRVDRRDPLNHICIKRASVAEGTPDWYVPTKTHHVSHSAKITSRTDPKYL